MRNQIRDVTMMTLSVNAVRRFMTQVLALSVTPDSYSTLDIHTEQHIHKCEENEVYAH